MAIQEELTLGIDLGIGSCGWAVTREWGSGGEIVAWGTRTFDVPETDKTRTPTNQLRRQHRGLRTVLRRRRQRMNELRALFVASGLISNACKNGLKIAGLNPWTLRADGLDRRLSGPELAVALGHIAKHRGFKSNSKRDRGTNAPKDSSKMLGGIEETRRRLKDFRSVGEMFARDEHYARRKRNRDNDYSCSIQRQDQEREVQLLFDLQRRMGNAQATEALERSFTEIAFFQRPLADSEGMVGYCPFEPEERRAAKRAYSFELFRALSRLATVRINNRALTPEEIANASTDFGSQRGMTFRRLRKMLGLREDERFDGVSSDDESKRDIVARSGETAPGTYALRKILGSAWRQLLATPDRIDRIAFILTFREDVSSIRDGLDEIGLDPLVVAALMRGVEEGEFGDFRGAGHISAKACRTLIPHLSRGLVYSEACKAAGYDHAKRPETDLESIRNPVARKALTEALKQVRAVTQRHGLPGRIHVELARDVGKGADERDEIRRGIEKRNKEKDKRRAEFLEVVGTTPQNGEDLLRFELWLEQNGRCIYTDKTIHPGTIVASDNSVQVDHILPWSRSGDDSFVNKTLCLASANQDKRGRTPFEWLKENEAAWAAFVARVESNRAMKGRKKRNFLLKDASILEEKFRPRNLTDTRYATRLLLGSLKYLYDDRDTRVRVQARPGPLTDRLRRGWGIQDLKKSSDGKRVEDDRHHALDALVVAVTGQSALQRLTRAFQEAERTGSRRDFAALAPPWPGFAVEAREKLQDIFVSRAERRRARGEAHKATIRQIAEHDGGAVVYERKTIAALTEKDLSRIKDPERNHKLIGALSSWIAAGKPKGTPPLSPKGDPISKVRVRSSSKPDVLIRKGAADRGEMVRVDIFRKPNSKGIWQYFAVPIYPHQVADVRQWPAPPGQAVQANTDESTWPEIGEEHEFLWSLYSLSFLEVIKPDGEVIEGYFRGLSRNTGALAISPHCSKLQIRDGIGMRTLKSIRKFQVDRLGQRFEIYREARTWHGVVCI